MVEYAPKLKKIREKAILISSLLLAAGFYAVSLIPKIPSPAIYQFCTVGCLVVTVMIVTRYLMRNYVYRVEPKENGTAEDPLDLTITEYYGNHINVVCRISLSDILRVERMDKTVSRRLSEEKKGKRLYRYTGELEPADLCLLTVEMEDERFFVRISADEALFSALCKGGN